MTDRLTGAVVEAARTVPGELLMTGADAVASTGGWSKHARTVLVDASPAGHYRHHAEKIARAWSETPELSGAVVAAAMRAAAATAIAVGAEHDVSLVWTGPSTASVNLRSTRAVLNTLVKNASATLLLVSYASHDVDDLAAALNAAADRGVEVALVLETPNKLGGPLVIDAAHPFASLAGKAKFFRWPLEIREVSFAVNASLHAKCVIADRSSALITSANLTSAGINDNVELGALIEAGPLPARLHRHFDLLIENETLERVS